MRTSLGQLSPDFEWHQQGALAVLPPCPHNIDTLYSTAALVQSTIMTLWSLDVAAQEVNPAWNGYFSNTGDDCARTNMCATEKCLLHWFSQQWIGKLEPNYTAFYAMCDPVFCDVVYEKSTVTKVVDFLSRIGGLWGPLHLGALLLWFGLSRLPWLATKQGMAYGTGTLAK